MVTVGLIEYCRNSSSLIEMGINIREVIYAIDIVVPSPARATLTAGKFTACRALLAAYFQSARRRWALAALALAPDVPTSLARLLEF